MPGATQHCDNITPRAVGRRKLKSQSPPNVNTFITHVTTIANRVKRFLSCADNR